MQNESQVKDDLIKEFLKDGKIPKNIKNLEDYKNIENPNKILVITGTKANENGLLFIDK